MEIQIVYNHKILTQWKLQQAPLSTSDARN